MAHTNSTWEQTRLIHCKPYTWNSKNFWIKVNLFNFGLEAANAAAFIALTSQNVATNTIAATANKFHTTIKIRSLLVMMLMPQLLE